MQPVSDTPPDLSDFSEHVVDVVDALYIKAIPALNLHDPIHVSFVVFDE